MVKRLFDWRLIWAAGTFLLAMVAFECGVVTAERMDADTAGFLTHAYWSITLFFAGGTEIGVPVGEPAWGRYLLWFTYFAAPALLISAIIEAVFGALEPNRWRLRAVRGHTVVVGTGHLARATMQSLADDAHGGPVVSVIPAGTPESAAPSVEGVDPIVVDEELLDERLPERLHLGRAERALLLTQDDCANLEMAARICERYGDDAPAVVSHVSELGMLRELHRSGLLDPVRVFNGHRLAARQLVETKLRGHFQETGRQDQAVLVGFGRFGQTVLEQLQQRAGAMIRNVVVVDRHAEAQAVLFDEQVGFAESYEWTAIDGDLDDPRTWRAIDDAVDPSAAPPVFVLGTPDEDLNLRAAMLQWERHPESLFVVRSYYHPSLARRMEERGDFEIHNVADLLVAGFHELIEPNEPSTVE